MRIVYGVSSEGMGHATRSSVVIDYLRKKGHDVHIFTSDRAYEYLSGKYPNVYRIKGFHIIYEEGSLSNTKSFLHVIQNLHKGFLPTLREMARRIYDIKPNTVISDFEFFTSLFGNHIKVPVIAANNISILNRTKIDTRELSLLYPKMFMVLSDILANFNADYYVIPTFFFPKPKRKNIILTNPVVRSEITRQKPSTGEHVLVYQTSPTCLGLLRTLTKLDEKFVVYGFGRRRNMNNMRYYDFNETGFVEHLRSAKAVIIGGGFSLISEALYLKKPILCIPLKGHFEQITNAYYIQKMKFGEFHEKPIAIDIGDFLLKLPLYRAYLSKYSFEPMQMPKKIEELVRRHGKKPDLGLLKTVNRFRK